MTVGMMWMRCLDKRDHVIPDGAEYLGAGRLKAACNRRIYPLGVSAEGSRRCCRACKKAAPAVSKSSLQRIPEQGNCWAGKSHPVVVPCDERTGDDCWPTLDWDESRVSSHG